MLRYSIDRQGKPSTLSHGARRKAWGNELRASRFLFGAGEGFRSLSIYVFIILLPICGVLGEQLMELCKLHPEIARNNNLFLVNFLWCRRLPHNYLLIFCGAVMGQLLSLRLVSPAASREKSFA